MVKKRQPGGTGCIGIRLVTKTSNSSNRVLVDIYAESQRNLLSNSRAAPVRIAAFHFYDCVDQFLTRPIRAGALLLLGRKQDAVFVFYQQIVEVPQGGRPQDNASAKNAGLAQERTTHTGKNMIGSAQIGSPLSAAVENQQLMTEQDGFGKDGTESTRPGN